VPRGTAANRRSYPQQIKQGVRKMSRYLLLWLIGVPIPILALIWIFGGLH
jgi:hypothetical protein